MKNTLSALLLLFAITTFASCNKSDVEVGQWKISYNQEKKGIDILKDSRLVFTGLSATYRLNDKEISSSDYPNRTFQTVGITDAFGQSTIFTVTYTSNELPALKQNFYIYPDKEYILTDFTLENAGEAVSSNYMAPVNLKNVTLPFDTKEAQALFIPYDNDAWVRYQSHPFPFDKLVSYEVSTVFDNASRKGLVIGSIEHDNWKTGIELTKAGATGIESLVCYGGIATNLTRDSKPHGALSGQTIKSPKIWLGIFDDWRTGLEAYGEANALVTPPKAWDKAIPFGWNSWGVLQFHLTYPKAMEVSDFFVGNLQNHHFINPDHTLYIGLDSGWNSFSEDELKSFVQKCKDNGQIAGVYWTPFTDWGKNPERTVDDAPAYKYKDIYVYANGKPQELDGAYAIDPTHPAIEERMKKASDLFQRCGFEYVKMDFMTHGALEGDYWYNQNIQTGTQAYNYGMTLLDKYFGDMYINLSISPIFPAQYAQSRRIACDAWNKIKDTEYTMNAVSYGWWIDRVYQYNDADHVVLRNATEGENRARVTSAVITGLYIAGDDFSEGGSEEGKARARQYLTNPDINALATGISFRPLEGNGEKSENQFIREDATGVYYVYFNYTEEAVEINIPLDRIVETQHATSLQATDLWKNETINTNNKVVVPGKDVLVLRMNK
ncbi:MAG: alpha-galactosidase [Candidatus Symbiothrix sp.]|jgi:alpha-galactosidase|nr:alpha-galactosidase [Candidatus Symbiothrix sp.]